MITQSTSNSRVGKGGIAWKSGREGRNDDSLHGDMNLPYPCQVIEPEPYLKQKQKYLLFLLHYFIKD